METDVRLDVESLFTLRLDDLNREGVTVLRSGEVLFVFVEDSFCEPDEYLFIDRIETVPVELFGLTVRDEIPDFAAPLV